MTNRILITLLFFTTLLYSCKNSVAEKEGKIDLSPNIYSFEYVYYPSDERHRQIYFQDILFLNADCFLMIYDFKYDQQYIRGKYTVKDNFIHLQFEKTAYSVYFPEMPATSAVDTNHYSPIIAENNSPLQKLTFKLSKKKNNISITTNGFKQKGEREIDFTEADYRYGLSNQKMQFLLDTKTIRVE